VFSYVTSREPSYGQVFIRAASLYIGRMFENNQLQSKHSHQGNRISIVEITYLLMRSAPTATSYVKSSSLTFIHTVAQKQHQIECLVSALIALEIARVPD
jgi:hypothetical protein